MLDENCIFCKIIRGEITSVTVFEDDHVKAFLDISQTTPGHTLLVPKDHIEDIFHLPAATAARLFSYVPMLANAIKAANSGIKGMNIINNNGEVAYQSVHHVHIHLIPRYSDQDDFNIHFGNHSDMYDTAALTKIALTIKENLQEAPHA
ncbi:HIT family protein [Schleiferilactobacillus harbinensis]|uniref:HIT family protein n=1 Tax=Schleiferilactobacillus harbinensis TaxID=304207 RepID=UPI00123BB091|nr:HIT family protein [Schleiferilactobacillus harbinensis]QEU46323.1 HIT family protein [Schleiferilactobacillus harbinensis]